MSVSSVDAALAFPELQHLRDSWVVCWYRGVLPAVSDESQPHVNVTFRNCALPAHSKRSFRTVPVPVTALGQLRLGTILHNGCRADDFPLSTQRFSVEFAPNCLVTPPKWLGSAIRRSDHWLARVPFSGFALKLAIAGDRYLWIPSLEFFTRHYGRSQEIRRILLNEPWDAAQHQLFDLTESDSPPNSSVWRLRYGSRASRLVSQDAVFLAHLRYDSDLQDAVKPLYAALEALAADPDADPRSRGVELKIGPWFFGPATLKVSGLRLPDGDFLGLRVDGGTEPQKPTIEFVESTAAAGGVGQADPDSPPGETGPSPTVVRARHSGDGIHIVGRPAPASNTPVVVVRDPEFEVLGTPRRVVHVAPRSRRRRSLRSVVPGAPANSFSGGVPGTPDPDTGTAKHAARRRLESEGVLLSTWAALRALQVRHPACIRSVEWYTPRSGRSSSSPPELLLFPSPPPLRKRHWAWLNPKADSASRIPRGLLLIAVSLFRHARSVGPLTLYFVEIERRPPPSAPGDFCGLVFDLRHDEDLDSWLRFLLTELPRTYGVFSALLSKCPGTTHAFAHIPSQLDDVAGESSVRRALGEMHVVCS